MRNHKKRIRNMSLPSELLSSLSPGDCIIFEEAKVGRIVACTPITIVVRLFVVVDDLSLQDVQQIPALDSKKYPLLTKRKLMAELLLPKRNDETVEVFLHDIQDLAFVLHARDVESCKQRAIGMKNAYFVRYRQKNRSQFGIIPIKQKEYEAFPSHQAQILTARVFMAMFYLQNKFKYLMNCSTRYVSLF